jgi:hypothetical protein
MEVHVIKGNIGVLKHELETYKKKRIDVSFTCHSALDAESSLLSLLDSRLHGNDGQEKRNDKRGRGNDAEGVCFMYLAPLEKSQWSEAGRG